VCVCVCVCVRAWCIKKHKQNVGNGRPGQKKTKSVENRTWGGGRLCLYKIPGSRQPVNASATI